MKRQEVPVKLSVLKLLHKGLEPIRDRLESLLRDYYSELIKLSQAELTALLEFRSAAATVELLVSDYFEQAEESKVDTLHLPAKEFDLLLDLSKTVEISSKMPIANSGMWVH